MAGRIYLSPPHVAGDEWRLVKEAIDSNWIAPLGPHVDAFEREFAAAVRVPHAVALSSGTAALHLAVKLCGVPLSRLSKHSTWSSMRIGMDNSDRIHTVCGK